MTSYESKPTGKRKFVPIITSTAVSSSSNDRSEISQQELAIVGSSKHDSKEGDSHTPAVEENVAEAGRSSLPSSIAALLDRSISTSGQHVSWSGTVNASFRNVLYQYIGSEAHENNTDVIFSNDIATLIVDAYPKAAVHLLLLPKDSFLSVREVRDFHTTQLQKIKQFHALGRSIASAIEQGDQSFDLISPKWHNKLREKYMWKQPILCGYHVIPSLFPLHLHIISTDFISPTLKNKGHWNKFTTEYFLSADEVETTLETKVRDGILRSSMPNDDYFELILKKPLTCHHCGEIFPTMPKLKWHIEDCMTSHSF